MGVQKSRTTLLQLSLEQMWLLEVGWWGIAWWSYRYCEFVAW